MVIKIRGSNDYDDNKLHETSTLYNFKYFIPELIRYSLNLTTNDKEEQT